MKTNEMVNVELDLDEIYAIWFCLLLDIQSEAASRSYKEKKALESAYIKFNKLKNSTGVNNEKASWNR